ncbi:Uncharacterised protein [Vibrio cholerae]|nr:Uncharacterised protein [Vibrio cholerae]
MRAQPRWCDGVNDQCADRYYGRRHAQAGRY